MAALTKDGNSEGTLGTASNKQFAHPTGAQFCFQENLIPNDQNIPFDFVPCIKQKFTKVICRESVRYVCIFYCFVFSKTTVFPMSRKSLHILQVVTHINPN